MVSTLHKSSSGRRISPSDASGERHHRIIQGFSTEYKCYHHGGGRGDYLARRVHNQRGVHGYDPDNLWELATNKITYGDQISEKIWKRIVFNKGENPGKTTMPKWGNDISDP